MYNKSEGPYGKENNKEETNYNTVVGIIVAVVILGVIIWYFNSGYTWSNEEKNEFLSACVGEARNMGADEEIATLYCECCLDKLQDDYDAFTFVEKFLAWENGNADYKFEQSMVEIAGACQARTGY